MGSLKADDDDKKEFDDSGYVQDEGPHKSSLEEGKHISLLDLSDDVLLCILRYCEAFDLKALGFTCTRLASLIRDRSLWQDVDARGAPCGRRRLRWLLAHALHAGTTRLKIKGFAEQFKGCQGHVNHPRKEAEVKSGEKADEAGTSGRSAPPPRTWPSREFHLYQLPRPSVSPSWPDEDMPRSRQPSPETACPGPVFPLSPCLLRQASLQCSLTELAIEYCDINCSNISLSHFPPRLTSLSLRGTKCYNMPLDKSFLFKIQNVLPDLEELDVSECGWLEAACLLPLSKLRALRRLRAAHCARLAECVAYASLAARYGFRALQVFDLRGSPLGDSEATALGWLPRLEELYLSSARGTCAAPHAHHAGDTLPPAAELHGWEAQEPEYFKYILKRPKGKRGVKPDEQCFHGLPFNQCTDGFEQETTKKSTRDLKRTAQSHEEPGPSKRRRSLTDSSWDSDETQFENSDENGDETKSSECDGGDVKTGQFNSDLGDGAVNSDGNGEANVVREDVVLNGDLNEQRSNNGQVEVNIIEANLRNGNVNDNIEVRPLAHVLFVNVGHQLRPVCRLAAPNEVNGDDLRRWPLEQLSFLNQQTTNNHDLITDSAIRSFGHSDDDNINVFHIGGPPNPQNSRPNKSNLRILSVVGYKNITDRSLVHLRTSAPNLEVIDFSRTGVTENGVNMFKLSRPEVEVKYSAFIEQ